MSWLVLVLAGLLEAVWALALAKSHGFTRLEPTLLFISASLASLAGLAWALRTLPVGTAYAIWVGIGAGTTVAWSMATGTEPLTLLRVLLVLGLLGCLAGLKLTL
jgi:quaternary ammonium compound-resistance protein SugE